MSDLLRMDYINSLPQPLIARMVGGGEWPVEDIEVQTGLIRCDIVGKNEVFRIGDVAVFIDSCGKEHDAETFFVDAYQAARSDVGVWMHSEESTESVAKMVAIDAMVALGIDPGDFKTRDRIIMAIGDRIDGTLDYVHRAVSER